MLRGRRRALALAAAALVAAVIVVVLLAGGGSNRAKTHTAASKPSTSAARLPVVSVDPGIAGATIADGFLGLSIEYWAIEAYAGKNPDAVNPVLARLIADLAPDQTPVLRIGGVSTDQTWWPVAGVKRPPGVFYRLNARRLEVMKGLADMTGARLIMGITFEADSRLLAGAEAGAMAAIIGSSHIEGFELGNEPELYGNPAFSWYTRNGHGVMGRPAGYGPSQFTRDFAAVGSGITEAPLAGPASGAAEWLDDLGSFLTSVPHVGVVTIHRYPFEACAVPPSSPSYPTVSRLLSRLGTVDQAAGLTPYVAVAHAHGVPIRIGEMNTVGCGNPPIVPNSFAEALWALDALFAYARAGVDGVNVHTWPGAVYNLFNFAKTSAGWQASVEPEYYGLLMFAHAAPAGSHLVRAASSDPTIRAWATRAADGTIRVTLINDSTTSAQTLSVDVSGAQGTASITRLLAPSAAATSDVTIGGQSLGATGEPAGPAVDITVDLGGGGYTVQLPPASAALLTVR
ncbi:MAG: glycosyl hydrolase family 79 C-terminal domain-containing protein [Solirubrobacteraceae bacterium]